METENADIWFEKGNNWLDKKNYLKALDCYNKAIKLDSCFVKAYSNKAFVLLELGNLPDSIEYYDKAIVLAPSVIAYFGKGFALNKLGNRLEAIECYDKAIELWADCWYAYFNKGNILNKLGNYQESIECYDKVIELKSDFKLAYTNKDLVLSKLDSADTALKA